MSVSHERLLQHLPAVYHGLEPLRHLLSLFESTLFGPNAPRGSTPWAHDEIAPQPLADQIAAISDLFNAAETPPEFLPWLSQWVALSDFGDLTEAQHRRLIAQIVPLYALRGTKKYLEKLLEMFKPENFSIHVDDSSAGGFSVGLARIGVDTAFLADEPFWFKVVITMPSIEKSRTDHSAFKTHWEKRLCKIIDLAKPVHTLYRLDWEYSN